MKTVVLFNFTTANKEYSNKYRNKTSILKAESKKAKSEKSRNINNNQSQFMFKIADDSLLKI